MKTIYHVYSDAFGEYDFWFDAKGKYLTSWHSNDASYRKEYMEPLFAAIGVNVEEGKVSDPRWSNYIKKRLVGDGASLEDLDF